MKREPSISEQEAREIVEKMGRKEYRSEKSMDDFYRSIGLDPAEPGQPGKTVKEEAGNAMAENPQVLHSKTWQCRRNASAANSAGCRWTSIAPPTYKSPRLQRSRFSRSIHFIG